MDYVTLNVPTKSGSLRRINYSRVVNQKLYPVVHRQADFACGGTSPMTCYSHGGWSNVRVTMLLPLRGIQRYIVCLGQQQRIPLGTKES